jgi:hypothetical protein
VGKGAGVQGFFRGFAPQMCKDFIAGMDSGLAHCASKMSIVVYGIMPTGFFMGLDSFAR